MTIVTPTGNSRRHFRTFRDCNLIFRGVNMPRSPQERALSIDEVRIVSDLRIMHSKVDELFHIVEEVKERHSEADIHAYSDKPLLTQDIKRVDEIYLWFVKLREERDRRSGTR